MNIILIGHRCSGKTSVGTELAVKRGCPFYDSDLVIEEETGVTIPDLVAQGGWDLFRQKEREVISKMATLKNSVIATGGGAIMDRANAEVFRKLGLIVWLTADAHTIVHRMEKDETEKQKRPSLTGKDLLSETIAMLIKRNPVYMSLATYGVDTSKKTILQVVDDIENYLDELTWFRSQGAMNAR
jgi:shikimate kinase